MRFAAALLALLLTPLTATAQTTVPPSPASAPVPVYGFEIVRAYPHDPTAFTQGLAFRDGELLESTGRYPSTVRRVRLEDGAVLQRRQLGDEYFGEGLTDFGARVLTLPWKGGKGFIWDSGSLEPMGEFTYAGEAHIARPQDPSALNDDEWKNFQFIRSNSRGRHFERWRHMHGCGRFFNAVRDTVSAKFAMTYKSGQPRPAASEIEKARS